MKTITVAVKAEKTAATADQNAGVEKGEHTQGRMIFQSRPIAQRLAHELQVVGTVADSMVPEDGS